MPGLPSPQAPLGRQGVHQRVEREKQPQAEEPQAVDEGVEQVGADGAAVGHGLDRAPALGSAQHHGNEQQLQDTGQQPARAFKDLSGLRGQAQRLQQRLQQGLKQPLLGAVKQGQGGVRHRISAL